MAQARIEIDVFSDIVCPWCWIGDTRLRKALALKGLSEGKDYIVRWNPFQLQPDREDDGKSLQEHLGERYGHERVQGMLDHVETTACEDGLCIRFDSVKGAPNTRNGHRLLLWVGSLGGPEVAHQVSGRLFQGYFENGWDLTDVNQLLAALEGTGLSSEDARAFLATDQGSDIVEASQAQAEEIGIQGVPFFIFNRKYAISGAQPLDVFGQVLSKIESESGDQSTTSGS